MLHILIFIAVSNKPQDYLVESQTYSLPTSVRIAFTQPNLQKNKVVEPQQNIKENALQPIKEPIQEKQRHTQQPLPVIQAEIEVTKKPKPVLEKPVQDNMKTENLIPVTTDVRLKGERIQPHYPRRALKLKQQGVVLLHVLVSANGQREVIKLHKPSAYALLNKAALDAVEKWQFEPTRRNGHLIKSWVEIPIEFRIH